MTPMAPTRPIEPQRAASGYRQRRGVRRGGGLVRTAIRAWRLPVDADMAVLLTSELVTNAISHETGTSDHAHRHLLARPGCGWTSTTGRATLPVLADASAEAETGRGLMLSPRCRPPGLLPYPRRQGRVLHARVRAGSLPATDALRRGDCESLPRRLDSSHLVPLEPRTPAAGFQGIFLPGLG